MDAAPNFDFAVVGAGIAGASAAHALQAHGRTVLLEREPLPGQHTTGRSAAFLVESYGNAVVRRLTRAGRGFLEKPPEGFSEHAILTPRSVLWIGREDQRERLAAIVAEARDSGADLHAIEMARALKLCPELRPDAIHCAALEPGAMHIDVAGLLEAFLRGLRARGGEIWTRAGVRGLERTGSHWHIQAGERELRAAVVVNAAGAWCDQLARLAGARPVGLRPLRRTIITFDPPARADVRGWPCVIDADEEFYLKPEGAQLLASPCDETPSEPCDAVPEDYEVALVADRIQRATCLEVRHIRRRWAGLRSFVPDRSPVIGMDPQRPGFFWLAGQGGFGIMTSPAAAQATAALITSGALPAGLSERGLTAEQLSPARLLLPSSVPATGDEPSRLPRRASARPIRK